MQIRRSALSGLCALAVSASIAIGMAVQAPTTWVVDDDGGPGVDFTSLQVAIDTAAPGDLILVRPGVYGNFDLAKALTILGEEGARTTTGVIHDVQAMTAVAELEYRNLTVRDCAATVVLDRLWSWTTSYKSPPTVLVRNSTDVRMIEFDKAQSGAAFSWLEPRITVHASRVELTSSLAAGRHGSNKSTGYAGDGGAAVVVEQGGQLHMTRTSLDGGDGGDITTLIGYGYGGVGGAALDIIDGDVLITGRGAELLAGGRGGSIVLYGYAGDGGDGIEVSATSSLRYSEVNPRGGFGGGYGGSKGAPISPQVGAVVKLPKQADPVLERLGDPAPGATITFKLRSKPGNYSRLFWGFAPTIKSSPGVLVDSLLVKQATIPIGVIPASGVLVIPYTVDPSFTSGTVLYFQAMSIFPSGKIRRTNSVPIVVR